MQAVFRKRNALVSIAKADNPSIITKAIYQIKEIPIFKIFAVHPLIRRIAKTI